jgi:hypothetical protein
VPEDIIFGRDVFFHTNRKISFLQNELRVDFHKVYISFFHSANYACDFSKYLNAKTITFRCEFSWPLGACVEGGIADFQQLMTRQLRTEVACPCCSGYVMHGARSSPSGWVGNPPFADSNKFARRFRFDAAHHSNRLSRCQSSLGSWLVAMVERLP